MHGGAALPPASPTARSSRSALGLTMGTRRTFGLSLTWLDETSLVGEDDRLHSVAQAQLAEHVRDVCLNGSFAEVEVRGELGVALAGGEQAQHLALTFGEPGEAGVVFAWGRPLRVVLDHPAGDGRVEQCVTGRHDAHGAH